jgi:hypothetical protein
VNPLSQPATILSGGKAAQAFSGLVDKVNQDLETKRMREELKQKGIADELLPMDVDVKDAFMYEIDEISNDVKGYTDEKAGLATQGVDITSPEYRGQWARKEQDIMSKVVKSKQHQSLYEATMKTLSTDMADENFDLEASKEKLAGFVAAASQGVDAAQDYLMQNGSLLVEKPFDIYEFGKSVAGSYKTVKNETDPKKQGNLYMTETTTDLTPESYLMAGSEFIAKPKAKMQVDLEYTALSPQAQAEYEAKAIQAGGKQGDGVKMYASDKFIKPYIERENTIDYTKASSGSGSGSNTNKTPQSNLLVDNVVGVMTLNPQYTKKDANGYVTTDAFVGQTLGTFNRPAQVQKPSNADPSVQEVDANGIPQFMDDPTGKMESQPLIIEKMVFDPQSNTWYVRTNESAFRRKGKAIGGDKYMMAYSAGDFKNLMYKIATNTGEWTNQEIDEYLSSQGLLNPQDKSLNVQVGDQSKKDVFYNGKVEWVDKANIKTIGKDKVVTLSSGETVKWDAPTGTWVKYEDKKAPATTKTQLSKGSLDDL